MAEETIEIQWRKEFLQQIPNGRKDSLQNNYRKKNCITLQEQKHSTEWR